jgi:hypothetical protein
MQSRPRMLNQQYNPSPANMRIYQDPGLKMRLINPIFLIGCHQLRCLFEEKICNNEQENKIKIYSVDIQVFGSQTRCFFIIFQREYLRSNNQEKNRFGTK